MTAEDEQRTQELRTAQRHGTAWQVEDRRGPSEQAQRLLDEATAEEWQLHQLGDRVQKASDDGAFGRSPAPTPTLPPKQFSREVFEQMLVRPWHKHREAEERPRSWQDQSADQSTDEIEELDGEDETGQVSALVPEVAS